MDETNELLRSAYQIAKREGKNTNWETFANSLRLELIRQSGVADAVDGHWIERATCTARTYEMIAGRSDR